MHSHDFQSQVSTIPKCQVQGVLGNPPLFPHHFLKAVKNLGHFPSPIATQLPTDRGLHMEGSEIQQQLVAEPRLDDHLPGRVNIENAHGKSPPFNR